ncbi:MAG: hypothetical protein WAK03_10850 [Methylocystis sp.]
MQMDEYLHAHMIAAGLAGNPVATEALVWVLVGLLAGLSLGSSIVYYANTQTYGYYYRSWESPIETRADTAISQAICGTFKSVFASLGLDDLSESEAAFLGCAVLGVGVALIARYATGYDALLHEKLCGLLSFNAPQFCSP